MAGKGTDKIYLGMSYSELIEKLGKPDEEFTHNEGCIYKELHWASKQNTTDKEKEGDGIFTYLKDNKIFEISFSGNQYYTEKIKYGLSFDELKSRISAPLYLLSPSANTATNGKDLIYMAEKERGIAYEIGYGYKERKRLVNAIYVFFPFEEFLPWGCISKNQTFSLMNES